MNLPFEKSLSLRPPMLAVALILSCSFGIPAGHAWGQSSFQSAGKSDTSDTSASASPPPNALDLRVGAKCAECGIVETIRLIGQAEEGADGRADIKAKKGTRHEPPKITLSLAEVTVRMSDGASHQFVEANPGNWRLGERVIIIERARKAND